MAGNIIQEHFQVLRSRAVNRGGFSAQAGGESRPDATAWSVLALERAGLIGPNIDTAKEYLKSLQLDDGRVPFYKDHPEAYWPTALAVLAWSRDSGYKSSLSKALEFLTSHTGKHHPRDPQSIFLHDPSIRGWPWIANTHSWVEPTAMALIALRVNGKGGHPRVREAISMIMDRQLKEGGWNYGNTEVFGSQLHPMPAPTGAALAALVGLIKRDQVRTSLRYLRSELEKIRTPLSLGWGLLALTAWGERPEKGDVWVEETLHRQRVFGPYDTASLAFLLLADSLRMGLVDYLRSRRES